MYTSYFKNVRNLPKYVVPISISYKKPFWFRGLHYDKLKPSTDMYKEYLDSGDVRRFEKRYKEEILATLDPHDTVKELLLLAGNFKGANYIPTFAICCREGKGKFCIRHLVADWLRTAGYSIIEYNGGIGVV